VLILQDTKKNTSIMSNLTHRTIQSRESRSLTLPMDSSVVHPHIQSLDYILCLMIVNIVTNKYDRYDFSTEHDSYLSHVLPEYGP